MRDWLSEATAYREADAFDRAIDLRITRLRRKVEIDPAHPEAIQTVLGGRLHVRPAEKLINNPDERPPLTRNSVRSYHGDFSDAERPVRVKLRRTGIAAAQPFSFQRTKSLRDRQLKRDHGRGDRDRGRR